MKSDHIGLIDKLYALDEIVKGDTLTEGVVASETEKIELLIREISTSIIEYNKYFISGLEKNYYLYSNVIQYFDFLNILYSQEKKFLQDVQSNFQNIVINWIESHKRELGDIVRKLENISKSAENVSEKTLLELQKTRLMACIDSYKSIIR